MEKRERYISGEGRKQPMTPCRGSIARSFLKSPQEGREDFTVVASAKCFCNIGLEEDNVCCALMNKIFVRQRERPS